jgi:hypothetical protein
MKKFKPIEKQILLIFIITIISGALRKWVFTSGITGDIILFLQLLLPFLSSIYYNGVTILLKENIFKFYFLFLIILAFNPLNLTIFHGIFGIILHLGFWWLLGYYYVNRLIIDIRPIIPLVILFCTIEIVLGFIQYQLPADHILNKYAAINQLGENQTVALVGSSVRITGTFSYISGYTAFLIFAIFFIWALIRADYNYRIISFLLSGTLIAALMTGSRSCVFLTAIFLLLIIFSEFTIETIKNFLKSLLFPFLLLIMLFLAKGSVGIEKILDNAYSNFDERRTVNAQSGEQNQRILGDIQELFVDYRGNYPFFGVGLGSTYQGATSVFGISDYVKEYGYYENELPRIVLEGGFFLLFVRIGLFIWLLSWLEFNSLSKIILFIVFIYSIPIVFNIYNSIFLALGIIFLDNISIHRRLVGIIKYNNI